MESMLPVNASNKVRLWHFSFLMRRCLPPLPFRRQLFRKDMIPYLASSAEPRKYFYHILKSLLVVHISCCIKTLFAIWMAPTKQ
jgi:hypothetical protein